MNAITVVCSALLVLLATLAACNSSDKPPGVVEEYVPEKPIEFPHEVHTGKNGIDCFYCHKNPDQKVGNSVCTDCHKQVTGSKPKEK